jgi:GNAT superfamily N-acetyltransferase
VGAIASVFRRSFESIGFLPTLHTPEEDVDYLGRVIREQDVCVAEEDERVVAFAAVDAELVNFLYVEPDAQGRGIGTSLLGWVKARRPDGFLLWTFQRNAGGRRFYERHGLRAVRLTDGEDNEEREPDVLYEWRPVAGTPGEA